MDAKRSKPDQYQLRFPPGLRDRLKHAADRKGRSMNAEIIDRLEYTLKVWPKVSLPDAIFERVRQARSDQRADLEAEITSLAIEAIDRALPDTGAMHRDLLQMFYRLLWKVPEEEQEALKAEFNELSTKLAMATAKKKAE